MARFGTGWAAWLKWASVVLWLGGASLVGCSRPTSVPQNAEEATTPEAAATNATAAGVPATGDPSRPQTFAEATRSEPPSDGSRPPDITMTGKSVGKLYTEIVRHWDAVQ